MVRFLVFLRIAMCSALVLLAMLLLSSCRKAVDEHPAQIELPADCEVSREAPGRVYKPFDGVYPAKWPAWLKLPEDSYVLGPISDEPNPEAATQNVQQQMAVYLVTRSQPSAQLKLSYADMLSAGGLYLEKGLDSLKLPAWSGKAYIQQPDGQWLAVALYTDDDTGIEGLTSLVITVSYQIDRKGEWKNKEGSLE